MTQAFLASKLAAAGQLSSSQPQLPLRRFIIADTANGTSSKPASNWNRLNKRHTPRFCCGDDLYEYQTRFAIIMV